MSLTTTSSDTSKLSGLGKLVTEPPARIESESLATAQLWAAVVTVGLPPLVSVFAVLRLWTNGVHSVAIFTWAFMHIATMLGITVGFHRFGAHRSFATRGLTRAVLVVLGSMAAQGPLVHWVSNHRRHHQYSDRDGDPHSPHLKGTGKFATLSGFWHAHVGWMFAGDISNPLKYSKDLLRDPSLMRLNRLYLVWVLLGLFLPAVLVGAVSQSLGAAVDTVLWAGFVRVFTVHHATWAVNSVTHLWGSKPFASADHSVNVAWLALPTAGESWHNGHHAFPGSARFGLVWWQLDLGYLLVSTLGVLGLASDIHRPSALVIDNARHRKRDAKDCATETRRQ